ncbi:UbiH/UbiF family hydroxylase [Yoonia sp. MH D7]
MDRIDTDIIIAGGGVAGLTAAAAFGTAGFQTLIVDPTPPVTDSATDGADLRTTAFLQPARDFLIRAGLWDRLAPHAAPLQIMRIVDASGADGAVRTTADFDASDMSDAPFGWNLPNWLLRREMLARLNDLPNVTFLSGVAFGDMVARTSYALVRLTNGTSVKCKLVIGADGRGSPVRRAAHIDIKTTRYGQKAIVFAVTHNAPHDNISTEVHRAGGPFTLVPLPDHMGKPCSSVVWMDAGPKIKNLMTLDDDAFSAAATDRSAGTYGPLTLATKRSVWPIITQAATAITGPRTALVAEAAHVVPPIGAQGLNMSLNDLSSLLDLAENHRNDLGSQAMLDAYQKARYGDIKLRITGIDALNRASIAGSPLIQDLRAAGIKALYGAGPLRRKLMELGLGAKG